MTEAGKSEPEVLRQHIVFAQFGALALRSDDLDEILTESCRLVGEGLGTDLAKVVELQPDGETLLVRAGVGWKPGVVGVATIKLADDTSEGFALKTGKPMTSSNIETETRFRYPPFLIENGAKAVVNVIIIGGKDKPPYGLLQVDSREPREFTESDTAFLTGYANLLAATVDRFRLIQEVRDKEAGERHELEIKVAERTAALAASNEQLDAFAYTVSHDLRAPLRAMEGFARILLNDYAPALGDAGGGFAKRIVAASMRMEGLIDALLGYSRLRRQEPAAWLVDPTPIVQRAVEEVQAGLESIIAIDVVAPMPSVMAEPIVLGQVLTNLISNAAKFQRDDVPVQVTVRAEHTAGRVRIWVEDNGIGIAPEHQERIFNVFERLHGDETFPGTGIGLAIVREGMALMGGRAGVESDPEKGSRFWIEFAEAAQLATASDDTVRPKS